jgi:hypothetical protein
MRYYDSVYVKPYEHDIIEGIDGYPVLFLQNIGSQKRNRRSGSIIEVEIGLHHKYWGITTVKVEASSVFYLRPLSSLAPTLQ